MTLQDQAYIEGFVKRASEYGYSESDAIAMLKNASPATRALQEVMGTSTGRTLMQGLPDPTSAAMSARKSSGKDSMLRKRLADAARKVRNQRKLPIDLAGE
jgi:hypothetical protein